MKKKSVNLSDYEYLEMDGDKQTTLNAQEETDKILPTIDDGY
jgi:hypothetical protein